MLEIGVIGEPARCWPWKSEFESLISSLIQPNMGDRVMLRKCAKIVHGEYKEWIEDKGISCPVIMEEKSREKQMELVSVKMGISIYDIGTKVSRGMKVA